MPEIDTQSEPPPPGTVRYAATRGVLMIIEGVAARCRVTGAEVMLADDAPGARMPDVAAARREVFYELSKLGHTFSAIGRIMGRDQSSVRTAIAKFMLESGIPAGEWPKTKSGKRGRK